MANNTLPGMLHLQDAAQQPVAVYHRAMRSYVRAVDRGISSRRQLRKWSEGLNFLDLVDQGLERKSGIPPPPGNLGPSNLRNN